MRLDKNGGAFCGDLFYGRAEMLGYSGIPKINKNEKKEKKIIY